MSDNSNIDPHSALTSLWPSDTEESKKLAEEKQIKHQNLTDLGSQFKQAREALGYNISDLDEHTGLSYTELEAVEQGLFQHIEQQDYVDYYVHTYAALLSLDADEILANFRQNYYQTDASQDDSDDEVDIHDESQYEDAFAEEARKTLEALDASDVNALQAASQLEIEQDAAQGLHSEQDDQTQADQSDAQEETSEAENIQPQAASLQADVNHEPITSNHNLQQTKPFPWLKLISSFIIVLVVAGGAYFANLKFGLSQNNAPTAAQTTENAASLNNNNINNVKDADRVPEVQKAKKVGTLESKITTQGSDDLNAPTAEMLQKPLVLIGEVAKNTLDETTSEIVKKTTENIGDIIKDVTEDKSVTDATEKTSEQVQESVLEKAAEKVNEDLAKASELAKAAEATKVATDEAAAELAQKTAAQEPDAAASEEAQLPEDPIQEALSQLPTDNSKFSLHATANSWILIEDDANQILFSGELTPEKIVTLPKVEGVIISLGDAGVIEVYKGKQLLGKLGAKDETLDLVSVEQRFNQISN